MKVHMPESCSDVFRRLYPPLEPIPTGEEPVLGEWVGVRAVLFDLYGTLFICANGEVNISRRVAGEKAVAEALEAVGIRSIGPVDQVLKCFFDTIEASHEASRNSGIEYPEVDIVRIWEEVLGEMSRRGVLEPGAREKAQPEWLAVEYEARANPVWPMPGVRECLRDLRQKQAVLGIISNAQFYSPALFPALLDDQAEAWGFDSDLQYYSYQHGRAKPGLELFRLAAEALLRRQIAPGQVLFVGNDMLNDILPAREVGFRTALFAGDARSLRRRPDLPQLAGISPDLVLTSLGQLNRCISR